MIKMPNYSYSFENYEKSRHVKSSLRDKSISHKHSREIALAIKGKSIEKLENFWKMYYLKRLLFPIRRYHNEVAHRSNIQDGFCSGRYPNKATSEFLKLLDNLESNAEYKGINIDRLKIISIVVHKATKLKRFTPRAMGRASPKYDTLVHIEMVAMERRSS